MNRYFFFSIFIYSIQIVINQTENTFIKYLDLEYTHSLSLINGNLFIIHKYGVIVYNYNFTSILYSYDFGGTPIIASEEDNNFTSVIQCKGNNYQYVIAIINDKIYVFSSRGQYFFHVSNNNNLFSDFSTNVENQYYSFLFYKNDGYNYYFIVTIIDNTNSIKIKEFKIDLAAQSFEMVNQKQYSPDSLVSDSVACQITSYNNTSNVLACFYVNIIDYYNNLYVSLFSIEENFNMINETIVLNSFQDRIYNYSIKSEMGYGRDRVIIIFTSLGFTRL